MQKSRHSWWSNLGPLFQLFGELEQTDWECSPVEATVCRDSPPPFTGPSFSYCYQSTSPMALWSQPWITKVLLSIIFCCLNTLIYNKNDTALMFTGIIYLCFITQNNTERHRMPFIHLSLVGLSPSFLPFFGSLPASWEVHLNPSFSPSLKHQLFFLL